MNRKKSLVDGIGNVNITKKYYDNWSSDYDKTLNNWNYKAPVKSANILKRKLKKAPKNILDLACGTGLFGTELKKIFSNSNIYGSDISSKSLILAKKKDIYKNLITANFETRYNYKIKFELVSLIGAMTYCKNFQKLFSNLSFYLVTNGIFIFSHRIDLWKKQDFDYILKSQSDIFKVKYISRPIKYLPFNEDFKDIIKIKIVILQKY